MRFLKILFVAALFITLTACSLFQSREKQLVMASDYSYYPYEFLNQFSTLQGFDIDLANDLAYKLDKTLVIKIIPFDKQPEALMKGDIDIILNGMTITPARQEKFLMIPYHSFSVRNYYLVFWDKIPEGITSIGDIKSHPELVISTQTGTLKADYLASLQGMTTKNFETNKELFSHFKDGKITALVVEPEELKEIKVQYPNVETILIPLPKERWTADMGIAVKKGNEKLAAEITKALGELKTDGTLKQLEEGWFSEPGP